MFEGELNGELATNCSVRFNLVTVKPLAGFLLLFAGFLFFAFFVAKAVLKK